MRSAPFAVSAFALAYIAISGMAPARAGEAAAATTARQAVSEAMVAPVKRTAPQMPANVASQADTGAGAKKSAKATAKKAR